MSLEYPGHEEAMILEEILRKRIKENARLREALEFYADKENYKKDPLFKTSIQIDNGKKARAALAKEETTST